ncbi:hypothetical protein NSK11_contig00093-0023 [Nocardia seriolae]|uniref:Uncharacterized protein n=1 Tax=Nocardia seriolae TaxID=37332 RepID=A0ABC9YZ80_9NOCA|nr:hypothetical protein NS07_v2contig00086-0014 [Nocardia seriolae]GAP30757.1 hypothetical protein NSK11_contig00093-0023 [Nocardia seriolae]
MQLQTPVDDPLLQLAQVPLALGGVDGGELTGVVGQDGPIHIRFGHIEFGGHLRQFETGVLEVGDGPAECPAFLGVSQRLLEDDAGARSGLGDHADPFGDQIVEQVAQAVPLDAEQVRLRHDHIVEMQLGGVLPVQSELAQRRAAGEPGHPALDDEQAQTAFARGGVGPGRHHRDVGAGAAGDEGLVPVENPVLTVADGGGGALEIRSGPGLGHGDRAQEVTGGEAR